MTLIVLKSHYKDRVYNLNNKTICVRITQKEHFPIKKYCFSIALSSIYILMTISWMNYALPHQYSFIGVR